MQLQDYQSCEIKNFDLQCGIVMPEVMLAYKTYGRLNADKTNVVLLPTFYTGNHIRNEGFFGSGRAIDPGHHFIISINLLGNGYSSSPSNTLPPYDGPNFPVITLFDNIKAQHQLITQGLGIDKIALVMGWSMAGCQSFQWGAQYPEMVESILPFCASAKTSVHNHVFLEGVKAALLADRHFKDGYYTSPPEAGLKAFARVYAGWAFSQSFYRQQLFRQKGFDTVEDLLVDWEQDHLQWDANNLLCKLKTWQLGDISDNPIYQGNFNLALSSIKARTIIISCNNDLYFRPADNDLEAPLIVDAEHRLFKSPWGHCVASPGNSAEFADFLDQAVTELIS